MDEPQEQTQKSKRSKEKQTDLPFGSDKTQRPNIIQGNPLLNELVLETVFDYLKGQNKTNSLAKYRTICKLWNQEIVKLLRKDTQVNLTKILEPYPDGMGWTASPENLNQQFHYPYPEVQSFENVLVTANSCEKFKDEKWIDWFRIMGSELKGLCFSSPLTCPCQNQFLERILKEWCPNLKSLQLTNVKSIEGLFFMSFFSNKAKAIICKVLKNLKISIEETEPYDLCSEQNDMKNREELLRFDDRDMSLSCFCFDFVNCIYHSGSSSSDNPTESQRIVTLSDEKFPVANQLDLNFVKERLAKYSVEMDGGIIGQIVKATSLKKIVTLSCCDSYTGLATFFHLHANKLRSSLKHLDLDKQFSGSVKELYVLSQLKFPLKTIKLRGIHSYEHDEEMTKILSHFSDNLKHLEISGTSGQQVALLGKYSKLILPVLPNLKTFVHESIIECELSADNILKNAPNLKRCHLKGSLKRLLTYTERGCDNREQYKTIPLNTTLFFYNTTSAISNSMKEFKLSVKISDKQAKMLLNWFPNLVRMEVVLQSLENSVSGFLAKLFSSNVEQGKIDFLDHENQGVTLLEKYENAIVWKLGNSKELKILEVNNLAKSPVILTLESFSKGCGKLTSLRLTNFAIFANEKQKIMDKMSHIPAVELVKIVDFPSFVGRLRSDK